MQIDLLRPADLDAALSLSTAEGWNQIAADWRRIVDLEPAGCFAARDADRLIGTVTTTTYGTELAWIGMMIVHPEARGRGIGAALMTAALDHLHGLGIASIKLDATPAGRPLYQSLGFIAEADFERWQGVASPSGDHAQETASAEARRQLPAFDAAVYQVDRSRLLERLIADGVGDPLILASAHGAPAGYALARRGRLAAYVGPVIAHEANTAERLLDGMLSRLAGETVCLDLHRGGILDPEALVRRGLTPRRGLTRMVHGERSNAATSPSIGASTGPEFG